MNPIVSIILIGCGAVIGGFVENSDQTLFGVVVGAAAGFLVAELAYLRGQIKALSAEVAFLQRQRAQTTKNAPAPEPRPVPPVTPPAVVAPVAIERATDLPWKSLEADPAAQAATLVRAQSRAPSPAAPTSVFSAIGWIKEFFTGGNSLVRIGIVILFFGVAFLLRYMAEHSHVSIELRLSGVALLGLALLVFGWYLRKTRSAYAFALQGGAVGILYLTVFAALRLYHLLNPAIAFPLLAVIAVLSAVLAVLQNSMAFAVLAVTGGFLAPVLASNGSGSHVALFSYYAILNAGILAMAWFKAWRPLNIVGFVFTFAIGTTWGVLRYRPEDFASTEPFLLLFFLFYVAISVLFTLRQPVKLRGYVDGTLVFGTPIVAFALQSLLLHDRPMQLAFSAIAISALYITLAWLMKRRADAAQAPLMEAFIALGVAFVTMAVPIALDARWTAAAWALEGTALVWIGCRQSRVLARLSGALLIIAGGCITFARMSVISAPPGLQIQGYFEVMLQALAALIAALIANHHRGRLKSFEFWLPGSLFVLAIFWWIAGNFDEINVHWPVNSLAFGLLMISVTALACSGIHKKFELPAARVAALMQLPAMLAFAVKSWLTESYPFAHAGWLSWPLAFVGLYCVVYIYEGAPRARLANWLHAGAAWLLLALFSAQIAWTVAQAFGTGQAWSVGAWAALPATFVLLLPRLVTRIQWPFAKNRDCYLFIVAIGAAVYLFAWSVYPFRDSIADFSPLPYWPLVNPLDVVHAFVLLVLWRYWRFLRLVRASDFQRIDPRLPLPILSATGFLWINGMLLRTLHYKWGIPYEWEAMVASTLVQTSLTILWSTLALIVMLIAARNRSRLMWLAGAGLLSVVIAKLFLVDLSRVGSVARIVSFVGVGVLMLVVGYFSPIPPAQESRR